MSKTDIGIVGLAVMGQNLALNILDRGHSLSAHNRSYEKVEALLERSTPEHKVQGFRDLPAFVESLARPRKILLMVKAGAPVDTFIEKLLPYLEEGDIIIDGGNSRFSDTNRRFKELSQKGIAFVGMGISGGEEGARHGPSLMPGGNRQAWDSLESICTSIAARVPSGQACCSWVGPAGAGHYVKMVHNGIEYGDMQLIAEAYHLMESGLDCSLEQQQSIFTNWNKGPLQSYLIEITANILSTTEENGSATLDQILDAAGQKGTGAWTSIEAFQLGSPLSLIAEATMARSLSAGKETRVKASQVLKGPSSEFNGVMEETISKLGEGLYAAKIISYAQGFMLLASAAVEYNWSLNFSETALLWREGCIIRSAFLDKIAEAYKKDPKLENLMLAPFFAEELNRCEGGLRKTVALCAELGIPAPGLSSALAFFDGFRSARLPANMIQAQRDYFGAHGFERIDAPRGKAFHGKWNMGIPSAH